MTPAQFIAKWRIADPRREVWGNDVRTGTQGCGEGPATLFRLKQCRAA